MSTFSEIKAKQEATYRNKKAKAEAFAQQFHEWAEDGGEDTLPLVVGMAIALTDSRLGRQLDYQLNRAASNQLFSYLKREPDELPAMSIGEINEVSGLIKFNLLERTLDFLGKDLRQLKPQRHMVRAGSTLAALFILTCDAVAAIKEHPARGYTGVDGAIAEALNKLISSDLPIAESEKSYYEWDSMQEPGMGVDATDDHHDRDEIGAPDWS